MYYYVTYLNARGWHLCWFIIDHESVPARSQRVVTDQILNGSGLYLSGVKVHTSIGILQNSMAAWITLRCYNNNNNNKNPISHTKLKRS